MKIKNILFIAIAILTIGLAVACSDEVVAPKDDSLNAYRVVESNGAFVYNGVKYETLQAALDAIASGKSLDKVITVTKSVVTPVATVADGQSVLLDLGGNTLTFYDVTQSALTIGTGTSFGIANGTLALQDTGNENLAVVYAKNSNLVNLSGVTINAKNQNALVADGVATVEVTGGSVVTGDTTVTDGVFKIGKDKEDTSSMDGLTTLTGVNFTSEDSTSVAGVLVETDSILIVNNTMDAELELNGNTIIQVGPEGHATVTAMDTSDGKEVVSSQGTGAVTNNSGKTVPTEEAFAKITRDGVTYSYYGSLLSAVDSLDKDDLVIEAMANLECEGDITPAYSVTINLKGFNVTTTGTTGIVSEKALTITGTTDSEFNGYLNAAGITIDCVHVKGTVTSNGDMTTSSSVFDSAVNVTGTLTDGTVSEGPVYSKESTFNETVEATGAIILNSSKVYCDITSAESVSAYKATLGVISGNNIYAPSITIDGSKLSLVRLMKSYTPDDPATTVVNEEVFDPATSVTVTDSYGDIGMIVAEQSSNELYAITLSSNLSSKLEVGSSTADPKNTVIRANKGKVKIDGNSDKVVNVYEKILVSDGAFESTYSTFYGSITVIGDITDGKNDGAGNSTSVKYYAGSTFNGAVEASGDAKFFDSKLCPSAEGATGLIASTVEIAGADFSTSAGKFYNITANKTVTELETDTEEFTINIIASTGYAGSLSTTGSTSVVGEAESVYTYNSAIKISNSVFEYLGQEAGKLFVKTVSVTSATPGLSGNVYIYGNSTTNTVEVEAVTAAAVNSANSTFGGSVFAASMTDTASTIQSNVTLSGVGTFLGSAFNPGSSFTAANAKVSASKVVFDSVTFTPNGSSHTFDIETSGKDEVVSEVVVSPLFINNGTKGTVGYLKSTGGSVTVDNSAVNTSGNSLDTGSITAMKPATAEPAADAEFFDVTLYGPTANSTLTVGAVDYAEDVVSKRVVFNGAVGGSSDARVATLTDGTKTTSGMEVVYSDGSTFNFDVTTTGAIVLYNSTANEDVISDASVEAYKATLGYSTSDAEDCIYAPTILIDSTSKLNLKQLGKNSTDAATKVTISYPDYYSGTTTSYVKTIKAVDLDVTAENERLTVEGDYSTSGVVSIAGGTFNGNLNLEGKTTITNGQFNGNVTLQGEDTNVSNSVSGGTFVANKTFTYNSRGTLVISGGQFSGTTSIVRGSGEINGICDSDPTTFGNDYNLYFANLDVAVNEWYIRSAKIDVASSNNLNVLASKIVQSVVDDDYVYINYTVTNLGNVVVMPDSSALRVALYFNSDNQIRVQEQTTAKIDSRINLSGRIYLKAADDIKLYSNRDLYPGSSTTGTIVYKLDASVDTPVVSKSSGDPTYPSLYWLPGNYSVTFNPNGAPGEAYDQEFVYGESKKLTPNKFVYAHNTFKGWTKSTTAPVVINYLDQENVTITASLPLYAVWEPETYTISYTPDHCTFSNKVESYKYSADAIKIITFTTVPEDGYTVTSISSNTAAVTVVQHVEEEVPVANKWDVTIPAGTHENLVLYASATNVYNIGYPAYASSAHYVISEKTDSYTYNSAAPDDIAFAFKVTPDDGYYVKSVSAKAGGAVKTGITVEQDTINKEYWKVKIAKGTKGDFAFDVEVAPMTYEITFAGTTKMYVVTPKKESAPYYTYEFGTAKAFTIAPSSGYMVTEIEVSGAKGTEVGKTKETSSDNWKITVPVGTYENFTVTVTVKPKITFASTNCTVTANSPSEIPAYYTEGKDLEFSVNIAANSGCVLAGVTPTSGVTVTPSGSVYTISIPKIKTGEITITANANKVYNIVSQNKRGGYSGTIEVVDPTSKKHTSGTATNVRLEAKDTSGVKVENADGWLHYDKTGIGDLTGHGRLSSDDGYYWTVTIPANYDPKNDICFTLQ